MKEIQDKKEELKDLTIKLRTVKFNPLYSKEEIHNLIKKQNEVYKRYKFYKNYLKIGGKLKCQKKDTF